MRGPDHRPVLQPFQYSATRLVVRCEASTFHSRSVSWTHWLEVEDVPEVSVLTQRAYWNGELAGQSVQGPIQSRCDAGCILFVQECLGEDMAIKGHWKPIYRLVYKMFERKKKEKKTKRDEKSRSLQHL